jgi:uncharacterized protein (TIGR02246 family)
MNVRTRFFPMLVGIAAVLCAAEVPAASADENAIRAVYERYSAAVAARDVDRIMSFYSPGPELLLFDAFPPRQFVGPAAVRKDYEDFFAAFPGPARSKVSDLRITVKPPLAYATGIDAWSVTGADGKATDMVFRFTDVLEKRNGKWLIVHEHISFPVDPESGKADFLSKP